MADYSVKCYLNVAEMKADSSLSAGDQCMTAGYYTANDGGGGRYLIKADSTLSEDGGSCHQTVDGLMAMLLVENNTVNVRQYGARDGILSADLGIYVNRCFETYTTVVVPRAEYTYWLSTTIEIPDSGTLKNSATIGIVRNVDAFHIGYFSKYYGDDDGRFYVFAEYFADGEYTKAICSTRENSSNCIVENLICTNSSCTGTAIKLDASHSESSYVAFNQYRNFTIEYFDLGIHLYTPKLSDADSYNWCNANAFQGTINMSSQAIRLDGDSQKGEYCSGNTFSIIGQAGLEKEIYTSAIYVKGWLNWFNCKIFDAGNENLVKLLYEFAEESVENSYTYFTKNILDLGTGNVAIGREELIMPVSGRDATDWIGVPNNILANADQIYSVSYETENVEGLSNVNAAFDESSTTVLYGTITDTTEEAELTITIECSEDDTWLMPDRIGYEYAKLNTDWEHVEISLYSAGQWIVVGTFSKKSKGITMPIKDRDYEGYGYGYDLFENNCKKIKYRFYGKVVSYNGTAQRYFYINRLFATGTRKTPSTEYIDYKSSGFLASGGGSCYGDIEFEQNHGIILVASNGKKYRLKVDNNGKVSSTLIV